MERTLVYLVISVYANANLILNQWEQNLNSFPLIFIPRPENFATFPNQTKFNLMHVCLRFQIACSHVIRLSRTCYIYIKARCTTIQLDAENIVIPLQSLSFRDKNYLCINSFVWRYSVHSYQIEMHRPPDLLLRLVLKESQ